MTSDQENAANAALIAAAPELLEALQFTRGYVEGQKASELSEHGFTEEHWDTLLAHVDAAIAKAEGRS